MRQRDTQLRCGPVCLTARLRKCRSRHRIQLLRRCLARSTPTNSMGRPGSGGRPRAWAAPPGATSILSSAAANTRSRTAAGSLSRWARTPRERALARGSRSVPPKSRVETDLAMPLPDPLCLANPGGRPDPMAAPTALRQRNGARASRGRGSVDCNALSWGARAGEVDRRDCSAKRSGVSRGCRAGRSGGRGPSGGRAVGRPVVRSGV